MSAGPGLVGSGPVNGPLGKARAVALCGWKVVRRRGSRVVFLLSGTRGDSDRVAHRPDVRRANDQGGPLPPQPEGGRGVAALDLRWAASPMLPHRFQRPASTRAHTRKARGSRKTPSRRPLYFFNDLLRGDRERTPPKVWGGGSVRGNLAREREGPTFCADPLPHGLPFHLSPIHSCIHPMSVSILPFHRLGPQGGFTGFRDPSVSVSWPCWPPSSLGQEIYRPRPSRPSPWSTRRRE